MKVSILGGSSFSTPALFQGMHGEFDASEFVLVGRTPGPLSGVARAARLVAGERAPKITPIVCGPATSANALEGADVVLIQMRIGNFPGREFDESFPLRFSLCGDEGLGPGGVSAAWRAWPTIDAWLRAIRDHAPGALVLMMSSPVGILTRAAHRRFPELNCLGICEVPYVALQEISTRLDADLDSVRFEYFGVNHIGWLYEVRSGNRDLVREWAQCTSRSAFPEKHIVSDWGGIPTKYLRLHFEGETVLASQRSARTSRSMELQRIQQDAMAEYGTASAPRLRDLLRRRDTPWYAEAVLPLLRALHTGQSAHAFFLSRPNQGHNSACESDDILEIGCRVEDGVITAIASSVAPPRRVAELIGQFCAHERVATEAVLERDSTVLVEALRIHPWVKRMSDSANDLASRLADEICTAPPPSALPLLG